MLRISNFLRSRSMQRPWQESEARNSVDSKHNNDELRGTTYRAEFFTDFSEIL